MYCDHFGLRLLPFEDRADPQFYYPSSEGEEALAGLEYAGRYGKRMAVLLGEAGVGKTLLVRTFLQRLHANDHAVVVTIGTGGGSSIVRETAKAFGLTFSSHPTTRRCLARLRKHLTQQTRAEHNSIVIFDQAENLTADDMLKVAALGELNHNESKLLGIVLVGQPRLMALLDEPQFARLRQQAFGECVVGRMSAAETGEYMRHRLRAAGASDAGIFDESAISAIHARTEGTARLVNQVCNACLVAAYGAGARHVSEDIVREVTKRSMPIAAREPQAAVERPVIVQRDREVEHVVPAQASASLSAARSARAPEFAGARTPGRTGRAPMEPPIDDAGHADYFAGSTSGTWTDGQAAADRLECAVRRAERARAMHEASLAQYASVEEHLEVLSRNAERAAAALPSVVQRSGESMEGLQRRGEEILYDFEQRVVAMESRAGRAAAAIEQAERGESALEQSCTRASIIEARLASFAEDLLAKMERAQEKLGLLMTAAQSGDAACANLETLSREVAKTVEGSRAALHEQSESASHTIKRLETLRKGINFDEIEAQQARYKSVLAEIVGDSRATSAVLDALRGRAAEVQEQVGQCASELGSAEERARKLAERVRLEQQDMLEQLEAPRRLKEDLVACTHQAEDVAADLSEVTRRGGAMLEESRTTYGRIESMQRGTSAMLLEIGGACERVAGLKEQAEGAVRTLEDLRDVQVSGQRTAQQLGQQVREAGAVREAVAAMSADMQSRSAQIESHHAAGQALLRQLSEANQTGQRMLRQVEDSTHSVQSHLAACEGRVLSIAQSIETSERTSVERAAQAESFAQRVESAVARGGSLIEDVRTLIDRLDGAQRGAGGALIEIGAACERLAAVRTEAERFARTAQELAAQRMEAEVVSEGLSAAVADAGATSAEVTKLVAQAAERVAALEAAGSTAEETVGRLVSARTRGVQVAERIETSSTNIDSQVSKLRGAAERVEALVAEAEDIAASLASLRGDGEVCIDTLDRHVQQAAEVREQLGRVVQDATSLGATVQSHTQHMAEQHERADALLVRISNPTGSLERVSAEFAGMLGRAEEGVRLMQSGIADSTAAAERLGTITAAVRELRDGESALRVSLETARQAGEQIASAVAEADARVRALADAGTVAREAQGAVERVAGAARAAAEGLTSGPIRSIENLVGEASSVATRLEAERRGAESLLRNLDEVGQHAAALAGQLDEGARKIADSLSGADDIGQRLADQESSLEAGERLMRELVTQAEEVATRLRALDNRTTNAEQKLEHLTAHPREVISAAQAQAAKLESVCTAVRKIFAGLSKAALESEQNRDGFEKASCEALERMSMLKAETERAAGTLQQWVAEASRAQERLAQTLTRVPSISQTHPVDALTGLSRVSGSVGDVVGRPVSAELRRVSAPPADADAAPVAMAASAARTEAGAAPRTRAEEIARMIADAKKAGASNTPDGIRQA